MRGVRTVSSYGDLVSDDDLTVDAADAIGKALAEDQQFVCWAPDWLVEEKTLGNIGSGGCPNVVTGSIEHETGKAYLVGDPATGDEDWFPKSQVIVYTAGPNAEFYVAGRA